MIKINTPICELASAYRDLDAEGGENSYRAIDIMATLLDVMDPVFNEIRDEAKIKMPFLNNNDEDEIEEEICIAFITTLTSRDWDKETSNEDFIELVKKNAFEALESLGALKGPHVIRGTDALNELIRDINALNGPEHILDLEDIE